MADIDKRVHANNRDHARRYVNDLNSELANIERAGELEYFIKDP